MKSLYVFTVFLFHVLTSAGQSEYEVRFDELLSKHQSQDMPGMTIGVVQEGKVIYSKGFGVSSIESMKPNNDLTVFDVASLAKQFTASCIWVLVQQGKISVEDELRKHIPEWPNYGVPIQLKHLLNHTSGIRNYHALMQLQGFDYDEQYYNNESVLKLLIKQQNISNQPGEMVLYSNSNYTLLALVIERVSALNLNQFAKRYLFEPLGMSASCFRVSKDQHIENLAIGYQRHGGRFVTKSPYQESYGAGSMMTSIDDLVKWMKVLDGNQIGFEGLSQFLTHQDKLSDGSRATYARGVMVSEYKGCKTISHSGYHWGGQAQLLFLPNEKIGIVILTNLESINPNSLAYQMLDMMIKEGQIKTRKLKKTKRINPSRLSSLAGNYMEVGSDMKMEMYCESDTLKARIAPSGNGTALAYRGKSKFVRQRNASVVYDFTERQNCDLMISFGGTPFYLRRDSMASDSISDLQDYSGMFYSKELDIHYHFTQLNGQLNVSFGQTENMILTSLKCDEFGNGQRTLFHFKRNDRNEVTQMLLSSEGTVRNVSFQKQ